MSVSVSALFDNTIYLLQQGSWIMVAIFFAGQAGWYLSVERWWYLRRKQSAVTQMLRDAGTDPNVDPEVLAKKILSDNRLHGPFGEVVRGLVEVRTHGRAVMIRKTRETLHQASGRLNRHLGTIAVLAAVAPLLGLTGTVNGIMATFRVITLYGVGNPSMMAGGIAQALMVTEAGLVVAFPLLLVHDYLQNRADAIESDCVSGATTLIRIFSRTEAA